MVVRGRIYRRNTRSVCNLREVAASRPRTVSRLRRFARHAAGITVRSRTHRLYAVLFRVRYLLLAALPLAGGLHKPVPAAEPADAPAIPWFPGTAHGQPFDGAAVTALARDLASRPFVPEAPISKELIALDYDAYRLIAFRPEMALWRYLRRPDPGGVDPPRKYSSHPRADEHGAGRGRSSRWRSIAICSSTAATWWVCRWTRGVDYGGLKLLGSLPGQRIHAGVLRVGRGELFSRDLRRAGLRGELPGAGRSTSARRGSRSSRSSAPSGSSGRKSTRRPRGSGRCWTPTPSPGRSGLTSRPATRRSATSTPPSSSGTSPLRSASPPPAGMFLWGDGLRRGRDRRPPRGPRLPTAC